MLFCIGCEAVAGGAAAIPVIGYLLTRYRAWRASRPQRFHALFCARCGTAKAAGVLAVCDCEEVGRG